MTGVAVEALEYEQLALHRLPHDRHLLQPLQGRVRLQAALGRFGEANLGVPRLGGVVVPLPCREEGREDGRQRACVHVRRGHDQRPPLPAARSEAVSPLGVRELGQ